LARPFEPVESGIARLLRTPGAPVQMVRADEVTWRRWAAQHEAALWQVVALHSNLDPDLLHRHWDEYQPGQLWPHAEYEIAVDESLVAALRANLSRAGAAVEMYELPTVPAMPAGSRVPSRFLFDDFDLCTVKFSDFHAWATRVHLPVVTGWPSRSTNGRWPWGAHTTSRLECLANAAQLWRDYVPGNDSTAPKNETVEQHLQKLGVGKVASEVMASMLRADGVRKGPRPR
jgi:hypothetical protein